MIGKWLRHMFWRPFELFCRRIPLVPLKAQVESPCESVQLIRIGNIVTRTITALGGGYDYSVCYLIDGSLLVDSGFPWARRSLRATLESLRATDKIRTVLNTHSHEDHIGNNDLIMELTNATIYAHAEAVPRIKYPQPRPWYRHFMFGPVPASDVQPVTERIKTEHFDFEVHHMPGHSPDHICLFEPNKGWLFSGDLYIAADIDSQLSDVDGPAWIDSLDKALALKPTWLFDGHGTVLSGDEIESLLMRKREFLLRLQERVLRASVGSSSLTQVTREVFRSNLFDDLTFSEGWLSLLTASDFSRSHLVRSFLK